MITKEALEKVAAADERDQAEAIDLGFELACRDMKLDESRTAALAKIAMERIAEFKKMAGEAAPEISKGPVQAPKAPFSAPAGPGVGGLKGLNKMLTQLPPETPGGPAQAQRSPKDLSEITQWPPPPARTPQHSGTQDVIDANFTRPLFNAYSNGIDQLGKGVTALGKAFTPLRHRADAAWQAAKHRATPPVTGTGP